MNSGLSEPVVQKRKCMLAWICKKLVENGMSDSPQEWDEETVDYIRDTLLKGSPANVFKEYYSTISKYSSFNRNDIFELMAETKPSMKPDDGDKITNEEICRILNVADGVDRLIFHMGVQLDLRYTEMLNLRLNDIYPDHLCVLRKDRYGASLKTIVFHPDTKKELEKYMHIRDAEIDWAKRINKDVEVPDYLFIHQEKGELPVYTSSAAHYMMEKLSKQTGVKFTIQTLRKTNKELAPAIEDRWDLVHGTQEVLDTYSEPDMVEENIAAAVNGDEFLSSVLSTWYNTPKGQAWDEKQKMQSKN